MSQFGHSFETMGIESTRTRRTNWAMRSSKSCKRELRVKEQILGAPHDALSRAHGHALRDRRPLERPPALMDHLKEGIGLRGYAQQDPLVAYKRESFDMFEAMMAKFQEDTVRFLFRMQILGPDGQPMQAAPEPRRPVPPAPPVASAAQPLTLDAAAARDCHPHARAFHHHRCVGKGIPPQEAARTGSCDDGRIGDGNQTAQRRSGEKVGRNDPCPCGSGKKYKKCHGAEA